MIRHWFIYTRLLQNFINRMSKNIILPDDPENPKNLAICSHAISDTPPLATRQYQDANSYVKLGK